MNDEDLQSWVAQRLPAALIAGPPQVRRYDDELVIILQVDLPADPAAEATQIALLREETRTLRIQIARELEYSQKLPVAWGMRAGNTEEIFTSRTIPVMTRLARAERDVLDTLVAAGVAETRSSALAYTVRAFATEHGEWLAEVRQAIAEVERVRARLNTSPRKGPPNVAEAKNS
ncbi:MAG: hypothetical protein HGA19_18345 [Oscillochloris sp.]|nr:hypothetical protein [Oscillochloris sp.]